MAVAGALFVTSIPAGEFFDPYEGIELGGTTGTVAVPTLPVLPDTGVRIRGKRMPHGVRTSVYAVFTASPDVAAAVTYTAILRLALPVNAKNADIVRTAAVFGVSMGTLSSGSSLLDDSALGTEVTGVATMGTTLGSYATLSIGSITNGVVAANAVGLIRIRRLGTNASETNLGDVIFLGCSLSSTT